MTAARSDDDDPIEVVITERTALGGKIATFALEPVAGACWDNYGPGAHIDLHLPNGLARQYSLLDATGPGRVARIAVLKTQNSRGGSKLMHEWLLPGHRLLASQPKNNFELDETAGHSVLIAGGIGITPLLAMARRLAQLRASFEVHYRVRTMDRAVFVEELSELAGVRNVHVGIARADFSPKTVIAEAGAGAAVYVCGPEPFMDFVKDAARGTGLPEGSLHEEHFKHEVDTGGKPFLLKAARSNVQIPIGSDQTAARALADAGVFVPTSCEQGVCGTCMVRVLDGEPDHRDVYQSAESKRSGQYITLCCSRSLTDTLTVDV